MSNYYLNPPQAEDGAYDKWDDPRMVDPKYSGYIDNFIGAESRQEVEYHFGKIDRELENQAVMGSASGWEGLAAGLITAPLDPITFVPIGGEIAIAAKGGKALTAARGAATVGGSVALNESALQMMQDTRSAETSLTNIAAATLFGGIVGGAANIFGKPDEVGALADKVKNDITGADHAVKSVGAAASPTTTLAEEGLKPAFGMEKFFAARKDYLDTFDNAVISDPRVKGLVNALMLPARIASNPVLRGANSPSKVVRDTMESLAVVPLTKNKNELDNAVATKVSIESRLKQYEVPAYQYEQFKIQQFKEYRQSKSKFMTMLQDLPDSARGKSREDGMLTWREFEDAISYAGRRNDEHAIPQVSAAAKYKRDNIIEPMFNSAKEVGLIDPGTEAPRTAQSYLNRMWNKPEIIARRDEFQKRNAQHLMEKRDVAVNDLRGLFDEFNLDTNSNVANAVKGGEGGAEQVQGYVKDMESGAANSAAKADRKQLRIDELQTRLDDATRNQKRIFEKILNKRERGDTELRDLFNEFRSVSSGKIELYRRLDAHEANANKHSVEAIRRKAIADELAERERLLEEKLAKLEDQTKLMEDLEYKASFDDQDFSNVASQLTDRILGTSVGRLSYDNKMPSGKGSGRAGKRGPAKARVYDIPDAMIEDFLINDDHILTHSYIRSLASDIELTKTFGSIDPEDVFKQIQDDYKAAEFGVTDSKLLEVSRQAMNADLKDVAGVWDRLRGTYGTSQDDYGSAVKSAERVLMNMNYMSMLGGMTLSAFADVAMPIMKHGIGRVVNDGYVALAKDLKGFKAAARDVQESGTALDMVMSSRFRAMFDVDEFQPFVNKMEAVTGAMASNFANVTLMNPWNAGQKMFTGVITQSRMLRAVNKLAAGKKIPKTEMTYLAQHHIDAEIAKDIAAEFAAHGQKSGSIHIPNARAWKNTAAKDTWRAAVRDAVDNTIVTPGQDKPLWMSRPGLRLLGQFRSFSLSAMTKVTLAGLQQRDAAALNGILAATFFGSMSYVTKSLSAGYEPDLSPATMIREGVDRSGMLAWLADANAVSEKLTRGRIGASAVFGGRPLSRYASRSALESILGPTYGAALKSTQLIGNAAAGDWQATDTHAARRLMPYNNIPIINNLFDAAEEGINSALGVEPMPQRK